MSVDGWFFNALMAFVSHHESVLSIKRDRDGSIMSQSLNIKHYCVALFQISLTFVNFFGLSLPRS